MSVRLVFVLRLSTKFEVRRPFLSEDIGHLLCEHLVTLTFDLKIGSRVTRVTGFHPAKFGLPMPFRSQVMLRHGRDRRTDKQTLRPIL